MAREFLHHTPHLARGCEVGATVVATAPAKGESCIYLRREVDAVREDESNCTEGANASLTFRRTISTSVQSDEPWDYSRENEEDGLGAIQVFFGAGYVDFHRGIVRDGVCEHSIEQISDHTTILCSGRDVVGKLNIFGRDAVMLTDAMKTNVEGIRCLRICISTNLTEIRLSHGCCS